jgi:hypothetical protein
LTPAAKAMAQQATLRAKAVEDRDSDGWGVWHMAVS